MVVANPDLVCVGGGSRHGLFTAPWFVPVDLSKPATSFPELLCIPWPLRHFPSKPLQTPWLIGDSPIHLPSLFHARSHRSQSMVLTTAWR